MFASTFTLQLGDLLTILAMVVGSTVFVIWRLAQVPITVDKSIRKHEARCHAYQPNEPTAPRGHRIPVDLEDTIT